MDVNLAWNESKARKYEATGGSGCAREGLRCGGRGVAEQRALEDELGAPGERAVAEAHSPRDSQRPSSRGRGGAGLPEAQVRVVVQGILPFDIIIVITTVKSRIL